MDQKILLKINGISKKYDNNTVLKDIKLDIFEGEYHAIVGENGAGKTTLMNILSGATDPNSGSFEFNNIIYSKIKPRESIDTGISIIHQDFALVPSLSVVDNISLAKFKGVLTKSAKFKDEAIEILEKLGESKNLNILEKVENLSISKQQIIEIAKALAENPKLLIMDEPTTSLTASEVENLFRIIKGLKKQGISVIYISHILDEVLQISDRITVLRDGEKIGTVIKQETGIPEIIKMMVGRDLDLYERKIYDTTAKEKETILKIENLNVPNLLNNINFNLKKGEILGFAGLMGAGRSELAQAIFGCYKNTTGKIIINNHAVKIKSPKQAMKHGIVYLPEDRKWQALIRTMSVKFNLTLAIIEKLSKFGILKLKEEDRIAKKYKELINIKTSSMEANVTSLSGGNQQKVVISRLLATNARIFIVDEPTQGIDVGAKSEIHKILKDLAGQGVSIILISSELSEILALSDRVLVMKHGTISGELSNEEIREEKIMYFAVVGSGNNDAVNN